MSTAILVVDDAPEVLTLVGRTLRDSGYMVFEAADGFDALRILRSGSIDLLVTDVKMPQLSGPEVVSRAWEFAPDLPVILMTGYSVADEIPCEMLCRALLLTKPFLPNALREAVSAALAGESRPAQPPEPRAASGLAPCDHAESGTATFADAESTPDPA